MKVFIGADHRGYTLKEKIARWLFEWGYKFTDLGAEHLDPNDDYTVFAERVASMVADNKGSLGILLCGSGVGIDVAANKIDGVRASIGKSPKQVRAGRNDDDMNILVIAADYTKEDEVRQMVDVFLKTKFAGSARFKKRLEDIKKLEANN
jgi:ribose 5-phosphate isomerase B